MKSRSPDFYLALLILLTALALNAAPEVGAKSAPQAPLPQLLALPEPDLTSTDAAVQDVLRRARGELDTLLSKPETSAARLADALGQVALLYHAHLIRKPAEIAYRNASALAPQDSRWPYYLGYLLQQSGRLADAADAYREALRLQPNWAAASLHLGEVYLELGNFDPALPLLQTAAEDPDLSGAALYQLGRLFLATKEYGKARQALEAALASAPQASRINYPLAQTYRALGDVARAREHLRRRGDAEPAFPDPLIELLERLSTGQRMLFHLGMSAAHQGEYQTAVAHFRAGLEMDSDNLDARVSLARFLYLRGEGTDEARQQLERVVDRDPGNSLAGFLLGVLDFEAGATNPAADRFARVLERDPQHPGARYFLAEIELRRGAFRQASMHYARFLAANPENSAARLRWIFALILQGASHQDLLQKLQEAHAMDPENPAFCFFLASLLAASPEADVRDGAQALTLALSLYADVPSPEHAELLAAAYAETGDFAQAQSLQQQATDLALAFQEWGRLPQLAATLERYRAREPSRVPWKNEALLTSLPPSSGRRVFRDFPTDHPF